VCLAYRPSLINGDPCLESLSGGERLYRFEKVTYGDRPESIDMLDLEKKHDLMAKHLSTKDLSWECEDEYRLLAFKSGTSVNAFPITIDKKHLDMVIFGSRTRICDVVLLCHIIDHVYRREGYDVKFLKVIESHDDYSIRFVRFDPRVLFILDYHTDD
jgi:hypothetical protein